MKRNNNWKHYYNFVISFYFRDDTQILIANFCDSVMVIELRSWLPTVKHIVTQQQCPGISTKRRRKKKDSEQWNSLGGVK